VAKLTGGLAGLAKQRKVEVLRGVGKFISPHVIEVSTRPAPTDRFERCIIATGSNS
jgi:dihydrolipoamide dehydrogenase